MEFGILLDLERDRRQSAVLTAGMNPDQPRALIANPDAYEPVTVRDHIAAKLAGSRHGKANTAAVREAARVLAASAR